MKNSRLLVAVSIYIFGLVMATSAQAVAVITDGDTVALGLDLETQFISNVLAAGGAGSWAVDFESDSPGFGSAQTSLTDLVAGTYSGLKMEWINTDTAVVLFSIPITPVLTDFGTIFNNPDSLNQTLQVSWTDSLAGAGFDMDTEFNFSSAVPVPAAVWLFGSGLVGLVAMARRKKA